MSISVHFSYTLKRQRFTVIVAVTMTASMGGDKADEKISDLISLIDDDELNIVCAEVTSTTSLPRVTAPCTCVYVPCNTS